MSRFKKFALIGLVLAAMATLVITLYKKFMGRNQDV
jgi:hypothetical protein